MRNVLKGVIEGEEKSGRKVVGVLGFSQGAALAAAMCAEGEQGLGSVVRFGIFLCSYFTPLTLRSDDGCETDRGVGDKKRGPGPGGMPRMIVKADIPSVHVQKRADPWRVRGAKVQEVYFVSERAVTIQLDGGHEVPTKTEEVARVVEEVLKAWATVTSK